MKNALLDPHQFYREPGQATNGNCVVGDAQFSAKIQAMLRRRITPGKAGRPVKD